MTQSHLSLQSSPYDPSCRHRRVKRRTKHVATAGGRGLASCPSRWEHPLACYATVAAEPETSPGTLASGTHGTRDVAVVVPPARRAGAGTVGRVTGGSVGALARLVAAESPGAAGAGDGAVHALPPWTQSPSQSFHVVSMLIFNRYCFGAEDRRLERRITQQN